MRAARQRYLEELIERYENDHDIGHGEDQEISVEMKVELFPHQKTSIYRMEKLERERKHKSLCDVNVSIDTDMGILGDAPGYGKTISILGLISRDNMEWDISTPYCKSTCIDSGPSGTYQVMYKFNKKKLDCNLIVASTSIIGQWEKEIKKTLLKYDIITRRRQLTDLNPNDFDVIVVSPTLYNELVKNFSEYAWKRFIMDEAASISIPAMDEINAGFFWFITATFPELNNLSRYKKHFLKNIFANMPAYVFELLLIKNSDMYTMRSFSMPPTKTITYKCTTSRMVSIIRNVMRDEQLHEMLDAGDIEGAIRHITGGNMSEGNLMDIVLEKKQTELNRAKFSLNEANKNLEKKDTKDHREIVEKWKKKVEQIEKDINEMRTKFDEVMKEDCYICCAEENSIILKCCNNLFGKKCISTIMNSNKSVCPMCRTDITPESIIKIKKDNSGSNNEEKKEEKVEEKKKENKIKPKVDTLYDILKENGSFIVFSNYDASFVDIKKKLDETDIKYVEVKGTKEAREKRLEKFKNGQCKVLLLNSKFNGAGINLTEATDVVLYHQMEDHIMKQVVGRANRIGRDRPLTIHQLVSVD